MRTPTTACDRVGPNRLICILGMHRSGTSWLAGELQRAGMAMGPHHTRSPYNALGNREDLDIVKLHEAVLRENGLQWDHPLRSSLAPNEDPSDRVFVTWSVSHYERAVRIISANSHINIWGFKDPRTLLMIPHWRTIFSRIEFVGIVRHPASVAESLCRRAKFPMTFEEGLELWYIYNSIMLAEHSCSSFPLLSFDKSPEALNLSFAKLRRNLGMCQDAEKELFFRPELRVCQAAAYRSVPYFIMEIYQRLMARVDMEGY